MRIVVLALVAGGASLLVALWQRRPLPGYDGLPAGVTLVTGPGCSLCGPVERALIQAGIEPRVAEVGALELSGTPIRSLPTALLVDRQGSVVMRRSGRPALDDAGAMAERWQALSKVSG